VDRLTAAFPLLLVAALAALTFWLERLVQPTTAPRDGTTRHDPDYIVENFVAVRMGPDGLRMHQLEASRMVHYPDDDSTHLEAPRLLKFEDDRMALSIKSRTALVSSEGKTVDFQDDVVAVREATGSQGEMTLTTELLHVVPDDDYARTDSPVKIVDANTQVTAVGLELIDQGKVVKLLSNVRGSYVKQK
jgi:lipopolysaccharide export system protein LptC